MKPQWIKTPNDSEGERRFIVDGEPLASVSRGWLRVGGEQWIIVAPKLGIPLAGQATMKKAMWRVERAFAKLSA